MRVAKGNTTQERTGFLSHVTENSTCWMARTTDSQNILSMYTLANKTQLSSFLCFFQETNVGIYTLKTHMSA